MKNKIKDVLIFPVAYSDSRTTTKKRVASKKDKPSLQDFLQKNPAIQEKHPLQIVSLVYKKTVHALENKEDVPLNISNLLHTITTELCEKNLWSWDLETITQEAVNYLVSMQTASSPIVIKKILRKEFRNILSDNGFFSSFLLEAILEQVIKEFKASSPKSSFESISSRLQQNSVLKKMPSRVIDRCVDCFFALLFRLGYLGFPE